MRGNAADMLELPDRGTEVVKDQEWFEKHFPWCRYMRETVSFVRHREVNTLGLFIVFAVDRRLLIVFAQSLLSSRPGCHVIAG
jgi:hypothetical protein